MPLTTPDDIEEPDVDESAPSEGDSIPTVPDPFVDGEEMLVTEAVRLHGEVLAEPEAFGLVSGKEFADLEEKVENQQKVIHDLIEVVEILGGAVDHNDFANAVEARGEYGSDVYPWDWDMETLDLKAERYE